MERHERVQPSKEKVIAVFTQPSVTQRFTVPNHSTRNRRTHSRGAETMLVTGASSMHATWRPLFVDEHLLVVEKDAGLLTVPGRGEGKQDCLLSRLLDAGYDNVPYAAHRLDRDTSGIVALGRTRAAHRSLSIQFQERQVIKRYEALVFGWLHADEGEVDECIGKVLQAGDTHQRMRILPRDADGARHSLTRWQVLDRSGQDSIRWSRVSLSPITGRAHQLRLHMQHIGHPILGDELHGTPIARESAERLCLHASQLQFRHPASDEMLTIQSEAAF